MSSSDGRKMMPFRELPTRPRMAVPAWLPMMEEKQVKFTLSVVNGVYQMFKQEEDATNVLIRTFETRDDDVFVCTFVKSGTTLTQQIITLLLNKGEQGEKNYTSVVPWMESLLFRQPENPSPEDERDREGTMGAGDSASSTAPVALKASKPALPSPQPKTAAGAQGWTLEKIKSTPNRRFFKSHSNLKQLPVGSAKGLKVIYVARNPKDVSVSLFHHVRHKQKAVFDGDQSDMIRCFVQGRCQNGSWFNHVLEWWEAAQADPEHVLFLHYESMLKEPEENIRKIADFAGIEHTPETIAKTVAASTIDSMRQNPKANIKPSENHLRKGGAGGWRDVYTVRESEAFDEIYRQQMEGTGLRMDFGEGLVMP